MVRTVPAVCLALCLLPGCAPRHRVMTPDVASSSRSVATGALAPATAPFNYFPLAMGTSWTWRRHFTLTIVPASGPPQVTFDGSFDDHGVIDCEETRDGRVYRIEHDSEVTTQGTSEVWIRYRQDASGLYEADATGPSACTSAAAAGAPQDRLLPAVPPTGDVALDRAWRRALDRLEARVRLARATFGHGPRGGALDGELTRLSYPLHPGQSWTIRQDPFFGVVVDAREQLDLPAGRFDGWRMHEVSVFFDPAHDRVQAWYGPAGLLRFAFHVEGEATDDQGQVIGRLLSDEDRVLTAVSIGSAALPLP